MMRAVLALPFACLLSCTRPDARPDTHEAAPVRDAEVAPVGLPTAASAPTPVPVRIESVESFEQTAAARGPLVALQGDLSCGGDGFLHTWSLDLAKLDARIDAALALADAGPPLPIVLVGYSQGADRAEALAAFRPAKYRAVVLIANSSAPSPARLRHVRARARSRLRREPPALGSARLKRHRDAARVGAPRGASLACRPFWRRAGAWYSWYS